MWPGSRRSGAALLAEVRQALICSVAFPAADAMYAPVVNRFDVYRLTADADALAYMDAIKALPAWQEWETAARGRALDRASEEAEGLSRSPEAGRQKKWAGDWPRPSGCMYKPLQISEIGTCPFRPIDRAGGTCFAL